jgi:acyl-lipid omega-6 desaturase (Delta-12 desaturase)
MNDENTTANIVSTNKINENELLHKYKSSYKSAFLDLSIHTFYLSCSFYFLWLFRNSWYSCFTILLLALLNVKTFIIFHDCCHQSYTPNKTLNYIISHITGIIKIISPLWGLDHNIHHLTNGNRENKYNYKYNELIDYTEKEYLQMSSTNKLMFNVFYNYKVYFTLFPFLYFFVLQRFIYIIKKIKHSNKISKSLIYIIFNHTINNIGIVLLFYVLSNYSLTYHYLTSLYISFVLGFILFHNQHTFNPPFVVNNKNWNVKNSGLLGSSFIQIPYLLKYFTGGIEYHHIHHINAKIPGYNLQNYHEEVISKSNLFDNIVKLSISDCYNNLKLRLYSEKQNKYIRLDEVENKYTSSMFYFINLFIYVSLQILVLLCKLVNPFCDVNNLYNNSLLLLDRWFLQISLLNNYPNCNKHILLVNHSSSCDGYLRHIIPYKNVSIVKNSLFYIPFLGQVFWLLNFIFIKRDARSSRNNTKNKIIQKLNENNIVQLFPQGTREKNKFFNNSEIVLKKGSIEIALETNVPIVLCYHNIGDRIDDANKTIHFHKKIYAVCSNPIILPNEYSELLIEEKVNILYKIIYDEFIRLEKIVLDKI